jgi:hypothetical protein
LRNRMIFTNLWSTACAVFMERFALGYGRSRGWQSALGGDFNHFALAQTDRLVAVLPRPDARRAHNCPSAGRCY